MEMFARYSRVLEARRAFLLNRFMYFEMVADSPGYWDPAEFEMECNDARELLDDLGGLMGAW